MASSGGRPRQALVHQADLLLLDEPTAGLDPGQRARFRDTLRELSRDVPVVVSTHQVDDLTDLFDTVVVIDHGQIRSRGCPRPSWRWRRPAARIRPRPPTPPSSRATE